MSDYGTADIPRTKESEFCGTPWEPRAPRRCSSGRRSMHAGNVTTPTLFVHGEADLRVPIEQGEQMYTALKKRRCRREFHPLSRQLSRRLDAVEHRAPLPAGAEVVARYLARQGYCPPAPQRRWLIAPGLPWLTAGVNPNGSAISH